MRHLDNESGIGLVELLIAMTVTSIGIMALVAGLSSGNRALERANDAASAASVADAKMESYRALRYDAIAVPTCLATSPAAINACTPTVTAPLAGNGRTYLMEVRLAWSCPGTTGGTVAAPVCTTPAASPTKLVRIVMKNADGSKALYSQSTTFAKKATG